MSYGVYLFHWPVYVLLRERGWQLATWQGAAMAPDNSAARSATASAIW